MNVNNKIVDYKNTLKAKKPERGNTLTLTVRSLMSFKIYAYLNDANRVWMGEFVESFAKFACICKY